MHYVLGFYVLAAIVGVLVITLVTVWQGWGETIDAFGETLDLMDDVLDNGQSSSPGV